jgi:hypothetical protein
MDHPILPKDDGSVAYIRLVPRDALPAELRDAPGRDKPIYAIHDAEGKVLALVDDRKKAFQMARMNELHPVSVH